MGETLLVIAILCLLLAIIIPFALRRDKDRKSGLDRTQATCTRLGEIQSTETNALESTTDKSRKLNELELTDEERLKRIRTIIERTEQHNTCN